MMRYLLLGSRVSLAVVALLPTSGCHRQSERDDAAAAVEGIWKEYAASLNAGDINRWMALWTDDGVQLPPDEPPVVGKNKIRARNEAVLQKFNFDIGITNQEAHTAGDWGFSRGVYRATLTPKQGGAPISIDGKYLTILARQGDGSWKIHRDIFNSNVAPGK
jgi:uncharacterized protein (TIGR02246 family)